MGEIPLKSESAASRSGWVSLDMLGLRYKPVNFRAGKKPRRGEHSGGNSVTPHRRRGGCSGGYMGTSLIRNPPPVGPYSSHMPRDPR